ncbi:hypothetical protein HUG20_16720 [Salicibibacter cibi]|uniref:Uncharacterized protein n=1 Tax=Salicibibacter cibi TaxID=2743001 RepID=A0A7T6ZDA0_9BACI|nr:hypothetical protein [Salicibibacter cibi]QQK81388.1 hypothetical protein HUG20_16720 [Salicibibacter cibi]
MNRFLNVVTFLGILYMATFLILGLSSTSFENWIVGNEPLSTILLVIAFALTYGTILNCMRLVQENKTVSGKLAFQSLLYMGVLLLVMRLATG